MPFSCLGGCLPFPNPMKQHLNALLIVLAALSTHTAQSQVVAPFEREDWATAQSPIDDLVLAALGKDGIEPANPCSDAIFLRRLYLDVMGTLPEPVAVREFATSKDPRKRALLIDALFETEQFADYWSLKWCDVLRVKAEFPINLWPNAVQAYHRWIRESIRHNKPYDEFARELLTGSGSNFRVPPVNFYRAMQGKEPSTIASAAALTFMGVRIDKWPQDRRDALAAFFSRVGYKPTAEWKEEIVHLDPAATGPLDAVLPDGRQVRIPEGQDPRGVFADWLISPDNPWFARTAVNRIWAWLLGRGIIHEPDDIRPDNPPTNPELLAYLEKELVDADYDLRHIYRLILNSRTYQQSCIPRSDHAQATAQFAHYPVRRLDAEVLIDALCWLTGSTESYSSMIPEPFTFVPEEHRTIALSDGSITSQFLEMFGRPTRDTGLASERSNRPTDAQRLHLLNSSDIQKRLEQSPKLRRLMAAARWNRGGIIRGIYLTVLSREPTRGELAVADEYFRAGGPKPRKAAVDLQWALINSKEFLYRH